MHPVRLGKGPLDVILPRAYAAQIREALVKCRSVLYEVEL